VSRRREGDAIPIAGDYQARALVSPRSAQRFWHTAKLRLLDRVAPPQPNARVADAGCGSGVIAGHAGRTAKQVVGFDSNPAAIHYASHTFGSDHVRFVLGPFERIIEEGPFDQIYCLEVLEHLYEEQAIETLRLFARASAPGAQLFVTTPNAHSAWPLIEWSLDRLRLVSTLNQEQHLTLFSRKKLRRAMALAGWRVEELGTFNGVAPFVAPLSETLAGRMEHVEFAARRFLPFNLLYARARVRE